MTKPLPYRKSYPYYSLALLLIASVALFVTWRMIGSTTDPSPLTVFLIFGFSLFTIAIGYPHPNSGHVSFDRVGQIACILVFGPFVAAAVSGAASFAYPIHRLLKGVPWNDVLIACLHNCGLMILVVLGGGLFYHYVGGAIPLETITFGSLFKVIGTMLVMQIINEAGMSIYMLARSGTARDYISLFNNGVEFAAGFIGILVAVSYQATQPGLFVLLLAVLTMGMLILRRFAVMRNHLETLVAERTAELEEKTKELELKATHDKLTGLYNRRYADDYLQEQIKAATEGHKQFTVALADIDHFKQVNDSHSHEIGDRVLMKVSELLSDHVRSTDTIARYGGEEFLLCFPRSSISDAHAVCEKLRAVIEDYPWSDIGPNIDITMSFGLAQADVNSRRKSILREADEQLYAAKNLGRNRVLS